MSILKKFDPGTNQWVAIVAGARGPQGFAGPQGDKGDTGAGLALKGSLPTVGDLPSTGNAEGDGWLVGGVLYVWNGTSWTNAGDIQGPQGDTGPQGPAGPTGPTGPAGSDATVTNTNVLAAIGYTPVNNAGDTMLGGLSGPSFAGGYFDISTTTTPTNVAGRIYWNAARGVPTFGVAGGNVSIELGETGQLVHNAEATALVDGEVVYLFGAHGDLPSVKRASNASEATSSKIFGVVTESIVANGTGFVTTEGIVNGLNTSAFSGGEMLWLGATPGTYTATKPVAPAHLVFVGVVSKANAGNGAIFVCPQNGYELDELHDTLITAPTTNDFLVRAADGLWKNRALASDDVTTALGYTPANKAGDTFTGAVLTSNAGGFTANSAAKLWTDSSRGRLDLYEGAAQTKSLRVMNANGYGIVGMTSAENLELWTNGVARVTINGSTGASTFAANATINSGADSRVLLQSSGVTQGQFQTTASAVRLASNNTLPLYLSQNGVDLLDVTTTAIVGNRQFRVPNSASYLYAFVGEQTAGAGKYNLYMSGTAANYLAGALQVDGGITGNLTGNVTGSVSGTAATITGVYGGTLTSGQVTTALGFTPYNATNPSGYTSNAGTVTSVSGAGTVSGLTLTGTVTGSGSLTLGGTLSLTSGQVTTALGFTPYDATNPSGYITSAALSPYLTSASASSTYQPILVSGTSIKTLNGSSILGSGDIVISGGSGTVTSVALSMPSIFTTTGSPVTSSGTLTAALASQTANTVFAAPNSSSGAPTFRALVAADIPALTLENIPDAWVKKSVRVATTANITLSGTQTIDGVALAVGDRVLVKNQTTTSANGIYVVASTAWSRAADANVSSELAAASVGVDSGTTNGGFTFDCDFKSTDTLGTTAMTWSRVLDMNGAGVDFVTPTGTETLTNKTLTSPTINTGTASGLTLNDGYTEEVFAVSGTTPALSPANGSIQTWALTANSTPTAGTWAAGQSITLMVDDGTARTITWTSLAVTWKTGGGTAPTLATTGYTVITLWKVGTTIYGARVGDA